MEKDEVDNVLTQILQDQMIISVEYFDEGFQADKLFTSNEIGWKSNTLGKTWVQIDFKISKKIKMVGLKSNSVSEDSDPVQVEIIGKSEGEWFYFAKVKNLNFTSRNMWKFINLIYYGKPIDTIRIIFINNVSSLKEGKWIKGVHVNEITFFE
jgi:hypothetical protein